jgi:hypothetical protein
MKSKRVETWAASLEDRPGALAAKLQALAAAGVNLEFIIARRSGDAQGKGVVFVTPIRGAKQIGAAGAAGFTQTRSLHTLRAEGTDRPGAAAKILAAVADLGVNLRGFSAAAIGRKFICHLALDTEADAVKAARALKEL